MNVSHALPLVRHAFSGSLGVWLVLCLLSVVGASLGTAAWVIFVGTQPRAVSVCLVVTLVGSLLVAFVAARRGLRAWRRLREHGPTLCTRCIYPLNVRAGEGVCPECGTAFRAAEVAVAWGYPPA